MRIRVSCLFAMVWFALAPLVALADDGEWITLFDGKTLTGWHKNPQKIGHGTGGEWKVEDGAIIGQQDPPGSGNGGILLTDRKFGDFELLIDMKPDWGVDSGLFLRGNDKGQCFQMMVDYHEAGNVGHIYGEGTGGFNTRPFDVFGVYNDKKELTGFTTKPSKEVPENVFTCRGEDWIKAWKRDDWNTAKVRVVGNPPHITTWINNVKINEFDGTTYSGPRYDKAKVAETLGAEGSVAVQVHGGTGAWPTGAKCRWKNVKIRELK
jgi:hypothetical protein